MTNVGYKECAKAYAEQKNCSVAEAERVVKDVVSIIASKLVSNGKVSFVNTFSMEVVERKAKNGINPNTLEPVTYKAYKTVRFRVGKDLKKVINR